MTKKEYSAVFISPHLDDAIFSCGGKIAELTNKKKVLVLNIFTSFDAVTHDRAVTFGNERLIEEENSSKVLNYDYLNLNEKDAYFRGFRKGSIAKVFYPPTSEDLIYLKYLKEKILATLNLISFDEVYVPLAIGWHIDHYLVHLIFNDHLNPFKEKIRFYEDAPYIFFPGARIERMAFLQNQSTNIITNALSISRAFFNSGMTQNIKKFPWRYMIMPYMAFYFIKLIFLHRKVQRNNPFTQFSIVNLICDHNIELKILAVLCYQSQVKEFFTSENQLRMNYINYSKDIDSSILLIERYWIPQLNQAAF